MVHIWHAICMHFIIGCLEFVCFVWWFPQGKGQLTTFKLSVFSLTGPLQPPPRILTHAQNTVSLSRSNWHTRIPSLSAEAVCEQTTGRERKRRPYCRRREKGAASSSHNDLYTHSSLYTPHAHIHIYKDELSFCYTTLYADSRTCTLQHEKNQMLSHKDIITIELLIHPCILSDISLKRTHMLFRDVH